MRIERVVVTCALSLIHVPAERLVSIVTDEGVRVAQLAILQHVQLVALTIKICEAFVTWLIDDILDTWLATLKTTLVSHSTCREVFSL